MNKPLTDFLKHWGFARDFGLEDHDRTDVEYFTSPDIFAAEKEKIFRKLWLMVAREIELPEPGDFIRLDLVTLDTEVVIVRDRKDGQIRAFHNACPHRGVALVGECKGTTGLFVCPYHGWSFGTDGKLKGMPGPENFPHVVKERTGLSPIHCDVWNGHIFLNFAEEPAQTLAEYLGAFGELFDDLPCDDYRHKIEIVQEIPTNWKNFLDAFNEGYHVGILHSKSLPGIISPQNPLTHMYDQEFLAPHSHATIQLNPDFAPLGPVERFVLDPAGRKPTDGQGAPWPASRSCGDAKGVNRIGLPIFSSELMNIFPLSQIHAFASGYLWYQFWPISADRVIFVTRTYYAREPASHREKFAEAFLTAKNRDIISEDVAMTYRQQKGMKSGGVKQLNIGENEPLVRFTHLQVRKYLEGNV